MKRWQLLAVTALVASFVGAVWVSAQQKTGAKATTLAPEDRLEIQELYSRYSQAFDLAEGTAEVWASTFTPDGAFGDTIGRQALLDFWKTRHQDPNRLPGLRHWTTSVALTPSAGGVTGTCYFMLINTSAKPPVIFATGVYDDLLVKTPDGWRFKKRTTRSGEARPAAPSTDR